MVNEVKKYFLFSLIACCMIAIMWPGTSLAVSAKDKYLKADACYRKLKSSSKKQKYRDQWFGCIKQFEAVYRHDPSGPWAAAGLYRSGELYQGLYKWSAKRSDKEKALEIIGKAYQNYSNDHFVEPYRDLPMEKRFPAFKEGLKAEAQRDKGFIIVEESDKQIKVKFNRCPTYEVYKDYGIPEVCQKYCDGDFEAFRKVHPNL